MCQYCAVPPCKDIGHDKDVKSMATKVNDFGKSETNQILYSYLELRNTVCTYRRCLHYYITVRGIVYDTRMSKLEFNFYHGLEVADTTSVPNSR